MDIKIKAISPEDTEMLRQLYVLTVTSEFSEYTEKKREFFSTGDYLERTMTLPIRIGAYVDDILVGYLLASDPTGGVCFIHWMAIHPDFHNRGLGTTLMEEIEKIAKEKKAHVIHLEADKRNVSFYERLGYAVFGYTKHGYYNADEYFMEKMIQDPKEENYLR